MSKRSFIPLRRSFGGFRPPSGHGFRRGGFTLVEVLVVAGIIGVISSVAVVNFSRIRARARDQKRKADLLLVQTALELHFATNRTYPTLTSCGSSSVTGAVYSCSETAPGVGYSGLTGYVPSLAPQFIPALPADPAKGVISELAKSSSYCAGQSKGGYFYASDGKDYKVRAECTVETTPVLAGDQFSDPNPQRSQGSFAVYSTGGKDI